MCGEVGGGRSHIRRSALRASGPLQTCESQGSGVSFLKSEPPCYVILMFYNWSRAIRRHHSCSLSRVRYHNRRCSCGDILMFRLGFHKRGAAGVTACLTPPRSSQERRTRLGRHRRQLRLRIFQCQDRFLPRSRGRRPAGAPPLVHVSSRGFSVAHLQIYLARTSRELVCSLGLISWTENGKKHENKKVKTWFISKRISRFYILPFQIWTFWNRTLFSVRVWSVSAPDQKLLWVQIPNLIFKICRGRQEGLCVRFLGLFRYICSKFADSIQWWDTCGRPEGAVWHIMKARQCEAVKKSVLVTELGHSTETNRDH